MKENSTYELDMTSKHTKNCIQMKQKDFGKKTMATKKQQQKAKWINNMTK